MLIADEKGVANDQLLKLLSQGGLTVPSSPLAEIFRSCFAILDVTSKHMSGKELCINFKRIFPIG